MVAVEGSTVDFPCQVGDLSGDVQWAKDGFLLGMSHLKYQIMIIHFEFLKSYKVT